MAEGCGPTARLVAWVQGAQAALGRDGGQTLVEYALIVGFIATIATIAAIMALPPAIGPAFQAVTDVLKDVSF